MHHRIIFNLKMISNMHTSTDTSVMYNAVIAIHLQRKAVQEQLRESPACLWGRQMLTTS